MARSTSFIEARQLTDEQLADELSKPLVEDNWSDIVLKEIIIRLLLRSKEREK